MKQVWYTVQQPQLFPPLYMVSRHAHVDFSVVLEEAQWTRYGMQTRVRLQTDTGLVWMSVPIKGGTHHIPLNEMYMKEEYREGMQNKIKGFYRKAPFYFEIMPLIEECLFRLRFVTTVDALGFIILCWIRDIFGYEFVVFRSSELISYRREDPCEWMAEFGNALDATDYVQGMASIGNYFTRGVFKDKGIRLWGQDFVGKLYPSYGVCNDPEVSILDPLMMVGLERTKELVSNYHDPANHPTEHAIRMEEFE